MVASPGFSCSVRLAPASSAMTVCRIVYSCPPTTVCEARWAVLGPAATSISRAMAARDSLRVMTLLKWLDRSALSSVATPAFPPTPFCRGHFVPAATSPKAPFPNSTRPATLTPPPRSTGRVEIEDQPQPTPRGTANGVHECPGPGHDHYPEGDRPNGLYSAGHDGDRNGLAGGRWRYDGMVRRAFADRGGCARRAHRRAVGRDRGRPARDRRTGAPRLRRPRRGGV